VTAHDTIRALLALSAAGVLEPANERAVREHVRECAECAGTLEQLAILAEDLGALPVPQVPADLAVRTQALMAAELATQADRREGALLATLAGAFGWGMALGTAYLFHLAAGGSLFLWMGGHAAVALLAAPTAAALYRQQRKTERIVR
jgi:predicted anti-sigma-YlaC factor YlaD